jgi:hypothetical protein
MSDQSLARPLPIRSTTHRINADRAMPRVGFKLVTHVFKLEYSVHAFDHATNVVGKYYINVIKSRLIRLEMLVARKRITGAYKTQVMYCNVRDHLELLFIDEKVLHLSSREEI